MPIQTSRWRSRLGSRKAGNSFLDSLCLSASHKCSSGLVDGSPNEEPPDQFSAAKTLLDLERDRASAGVSSADRTRIRYLVSWKRAPYCVLSLQPSLDVQSCLSSSVQSLCAPTFSIVGGTMCHPLSDESASKGRAKSFLLPSSGSI